ncbi:hypothetical protein NST38_31450 [Paenibacillus sp. FSL H8-0104]|uniref:hypothetical protein n=1 Tax=Paenibacillus sp. FSL H8-0104 TaxID=2954509 RepID=UPI0030FD5827
MKMFINTTEEITLLTNKYLSSYADLRIEGFKTLEQANYFDWSINPPLVLKMVTEMSMFLTSDSFVIMIVITNPEQNLSTLVVLHGMLEIEKILRSVYEYIRKLNNNDPQHTVSILASVGRLLYRAIEHMYFGGDNLVEINERFKDKIMEQYRILDDEYWIECIIE